MSRLKITGKELRAIGYPEGPVISIESQNQLVDTIGRFTPKIVKMDGVKHRVWGKRRNELPGE